MKTIVTEIDLDLDGVFADFDGGILKITGKLPHELEKRDMWKAVARNKTFFEDLELLPDAMDLWNYVSKLPVTLRVLTGLPTVNDGAGQKKRWVAKTLSDKIEVNVCRSKDKYLFAKPGRLLIDDRTKMVEPYRDAGGLAILHRSTVETIGHLQALGL